MELKDNYKIKKIANFDGSDAEKLATATTGNKTGSGGFWDAIFSEGGGSFMKGLGQGIASIFGRNTDTYDQSQYQTNESSSIGFGSILLYGGGAIVLILLIVLFTRK